MTRNRLALIGLLAMALAGFVSFSIYRVLNGAVNTSRANALTTVVAAANDFPAGTKLDESDLRLSKMPRNDLPPGSFSSVSEVVGRAVTVPLLKEWLDANLPPIVERLVRAEIERVVGRVIP